MVEYFRVLVRSVGIWGTWNCPMLLSYTFRASMRIAPLVCLFVSFLLDVDVDVDSSCDFACLESCRSCSFHCWGVRCLAGSYLSKLMGFGFCWVSIVSMVVDMD